MVLDEKLNPMLFPVERCYCIKGKILPIERSVILDALNCYQKKLEVDDCSWSKELSSKRDYLIERTQELTKKFEEMNFE